MPRLIAAVYVQAPTTREELILLPGECPDPEIAALVTNPDAWDEPPEECAAEPIAIGEPDPTGGKAATEAEDQGAEVGGGGGAKKSPPRRTRPSASS